MTGMQAPPGWGVGELVGRYRLEAPVGEGSYGEVWKAVDTGNKDAPVAVKALKARPVRYGTVPDEDELDEERRERGRFQHEAEVTWSLGRGPHILEVLGQGEHAGRPYFVMPYIPPPNLKDLVRKGAVPVERAVRIAEQVAAALAWAHEHGRIHRDLKPTNVLLGSVDGEEYAYLADFGSVGALDGLGRAPHTRTGELAPSTEPYMSPERFRFDRDGRALVAPNEGFDVYALACVLHECLTGARAFPAGRPAHEDPYRPRPSDHDSSLAPFDGIVLRGLAHDPAVRLRDAELFVAELRSATKRWRRTSVGTPADDTAVPSPADVHVHVPEAREGGEVLLEDAPSTAVRERAAAVAETAEGAEQDAVQEETDVPSGRGAAAPRSAWTSPLSVGAATGLAGCAGALVGDLGPGAAAVVILSSWCVGVGGTLWWDRRSG